MQVVFFAINFVAFVIILTLLLRKPIARYLKNRKDTFVNGNIEAKTYYDDALHELNKAKDDIRNVDQNGRARIDEVMDQAKAEANLIVLNAESYSKAMLVGTEEMMKEEAEQTKNKEITNFIHSVVANTKRDVKSEATQNGYGGVYIKDYFAENKRANI